MSPRVSDNVELFPCFARVDRQVVGWQILLHGRITRPRQDGFQRRFIDKFYRRAFRISLAEAESAIYQQRIEGFLDAALRGVQVALHLPCRSLLLPCRTSANGHFRCVVRARPDDLGERHAASAPHDWVGIRVDSMASGATAAGHVQLIAARGISVISDIDDTLRFSHVNERRRLIEATFLRPFRAIEGMAHVYQAWRDAGAAFHYVSSSPWQLYRPVQQFLADAGFPRGSFHLRSMRWRDPSILQLLIAKKQSKVRAIRMLLKWFPDRQFLLVGDSAERDPEIYGAAARRFPEQVVGIFIRKIPETILDDRRLQRAFAELPPSKWTLFQDPAQIPPLDRLGIRPHNHLTTI